MNGAPGWQANQGTLAQDLVMTGHGLHTGRRVNVRIRPAGAGHGIVFVRVRDGRTLARLPASPGLRLAQPLCTALQADNGLRVRTVEHLLAALLACEIDHATVELDAEEVPILDGSALPWVRAMEACGRAALPAPKRFIRVLRRLAVADGEMRQLVIEPAGRYELHVTNDLKGFGVLSWQGEINPARFTSEIAPSRSYGRLKWAIPTIAYGYLRGRPVLRGARPSCTATIVGGSVLGGMRLPEEFVRHRALDLIGDLALLGAPLLARVTALRPSHEMNYRLSSALLAQTDAWEWAGPAI
ncbi:UDP-3-O-acyl N-acetylglycosamine deacetylase [Cupriavidus basilensis]|uniref:UDP-3-O-acyl-N-acetylglucosamine deacetylase n=1 Tax=Cupriavidus basilensis TaxID=68895 RepID=A0ABT6B008_9BURK|nr:UDP-3-O-acyl N-acetylglycosamine deacetylase [Cupriavidus basilensis]MDF3838074.1 UDP-3-O-acyl N-acetylglycosamine deacetylase [Cupriavidus basilensis]